METEKQLVADGIVSVDAIKNKINAWSYLWEFGTLKRTEIKALLAEIDRLRAENEALKKENK